MGLGSIFFKPDPEKVPAPAPEQDQAATPAPVRSSRAGAATRGKAVAAEPEEDAPADDTASDGGINKKIMDGLEQALTDSTPKDYGYLQFRTALEKMAKKIPNEGARYAAALAAAEGMGCDAAKITSTAQAALKVLAGEQKQFNDEIDDTQRADAAKQAEVTDLDTQIHALQVKQTKLNKELAISAAKIQTDQQDFAATYKQLTNEIKGDIEKVSEYSTTSK
jgi:hypothetical protein